MPLNGGTCAAYGDMPLSNGALCNGGYCRGVSVHLVSVCLV